MEYGVGFVNTTTQQLYDFELPEVEWDPLGHPGQMVELHAYRGPTLDTQLLGCKGKKDYAGNYWFFAIANRDGGNDQTNPDMLYLCRATRLPGDLMQISVALCPEFSEGVVCKPTQLTVDKNGAVYYTSGVIGQTLVYAYKAVVDTETPFVITFTNGILNGGNPLVTWNSIGITLSKDHTYAVAYDIFTIDAVNSDVIDSIDTDTLTLTTSAGLGVTSTIHPCNLETDVSGGSNDDYAVTYFEGPGENIDSGFILASPCLNLGPDLTTFADAGLGYNRSVAIRPDGSLFTLVRFEYCPGNPNRCVFYVPQPDHSYAGEATVGLTCPMEMPTHMDLQRLGAQAGNRWLGAGRIQDNGEIREWDNIGIQTTIAGARAGYQYIGTGADREVHS